MLLQTIFTLPFIVTSVTSTPPPGYQKKPEELDNNPPKYEYGYKISDAHGTGQGKVETRDGLYALGRYYVQGTESSQSVQYFADDWGYHPVVEYSNTGPHSQTSAHIALGEEAVKVLQNNNKNISPELSKSVENLEININNKIKSKLPSDGTTSPHILQTPTTPTKEPLLIHVPDPEEPTPVVFLSTQQPELEVTSNLVQPANDERNLYTINPDNTISNEGTQAEIKQENLKTHNIEQNTQELNQQQQIINSQVGQFSQEQNDYNQIKTEQQSSVSHFNNLKETDAQQEQSFVVYQPSALPILYQQQVVPNNVDVMYLHTTDLSKSTPLLSTSSPQDVSTDNLYHNTHYTSSQHSIQHQDSNVNIEDIVGTTVNNNQQNENSNQEETNLQNESQISNTQKIQESSEVIRHEEKVVQNQDSGNYLKQILKDNAVINKGQEKNVESSESKQKLGEDFQIDVRFGNPSDNPEVSNQQSIVEQNAESVETHNENHVSTVQSVQLDKSAITENQEHDIEYLLQHVAGYIEEQESLHKASHVSKESTATKSTQNNQEANGKELFTPNTSINPIQETYRSNIPSEEKYNENKNAFDNNLQYETAALYETKNRVVHQQLISDKSNYDESILYQEHPGGYGAKLNGVAIPQPNTKQRDRNQPSRLIENTKNLVTGQDVLNINQAISMNLEKSNLENSAENIIKNNFSTGYSIIPQQYQTVNQQYKETNQLHHQQESTNQKYHSVNDQNQAGESIFLSEHNNIISSTTESNVFESNRFVSSTLSPLVISTIAAPHQTLEEHKQPHDQFSFTKEPIVVGEVGNTEKQVGVSETHQVSEKLKEEFYSTTQNTVETRISENTFGATESTVVVTPRPVSTKFLAPITAGIRLHNIERKKPKILNHNVVVEVQKSVPYYLGRFEYVENPDGSHERINDSNENLQSFESLLNVGPTASSDNTLGVSFIQELPKPEALVQAFNSEKTKEQSDKVNNINLAEQQLPKVNVENKFSENADQLQENTAKNTQVQQLPEEVINQEFREPENPQGSTYQQHIAILSQQLPKVENNNQFNEQVENSNSLQLTNPIFFQQLPTAGGIQILEDNIENFGGYQIINPLTLQHLPTAEAQIFNQDTNQAQSAPPTSQTVVQTVESPVHITKYVDRPYPVQVPIHVPFKVPVPIETKVHVPVERIVERKIPVTKYIEKPIHVPYPVEKIIEKKVPIEVTKYIDRPYPVRVFVPQPYPVEKIVEKIVKQPYPVEVKVPYEVKVPVPHPVTVEKIVERKVPVPHYIDKPYPVEKIVEKPVPQYIEKPYPVHVRVPVPVAQPYPVHVHVPKPYPVEVTKVVEKPVPQPYAVEVKVPHPVPVEVPKYIDRPVDRPYPIYFNSHHQKSSPITQFKSHVHNGIKSLYHNLHQTFKHIDTTYPKQYFYAPNYHPNLRWKPHSTYYTINSDDYIGMVPPKPIQNYGPGPRKYRNTRESFAKNLRIEYGFMPPLRPSIEIDENGNPIESAASE